MMYIISHLNIYTSVSGGVIQQIHDEQLHHITAIIGVGRGGARGGGGPGPPNNLGGGPTYPLAPPNNPQAFSFNFYVKQEKSQMYQVEG